MYLGNGRMLVSIYKYTSKQEQNDQIMDAEMKWSLWFELEWIEHAKIPERDLNAIGLFATKGWLKNLYRFSYELCWACLHVCKSWFLCEKAKNIKSLGLWLLSWDSVCSMECSLTRRLRESNTWRERAQEEFSIFYPHATSGMILQSQKESFTLTMDKEAFLQPVWKIFLPFNFIYINQPRRDHHWKWKKQNLSIQQQAMGMLAWIEKLWMQHKLF